MSEGPRVRGMSRLHSKLKASLDEGNFYEAHQLYRIINFRLLSGKKYVECEEILFEGANKLFEEQQMSSGVDLSKLYMQILQEGDIDPQERIFVRVSTLYKSIPSESPDKNTFLSLAIQWSANEGYPNGHQRLHQLFAHSLWSIKRYPESRHHFLYSSDGSGCGSMLAEFHFHQGFPREIDLFVVGTVLQFLCLRKHVTAAFALLTYVEKHPGIKKGPPYAHPLLNFVWLLLIAIENKQSLSTFMILIEKYKTSLERDPSYLEYLDKIGQTFFGVPAPKKKLPTDVFSGLFDSFFSAVNDSTENEGQSRDQPHNNTNLSRRMETEDLD
ncbi:Golgi to ER traffic protein 4 homolog A [Lepeophtheirus salmonis]|nr:Golgi to ER traffic protein 4 homolog [Lepeophtheirus salmonis]